MHAFFISYRHGDAGDSAQRLFGELVRRFGARSVFMDATGAGPGRDFREAIDGPAAARSVLLALIGPRWLDARNEAGARRLDDPRDHVRREAASALKRGVPIVALLLEDAHMPQPSELPAELGALAFSHAVQLRRGHWDSDVAVLVRSLSQYVAPSSIDPVVRGVRGSERQRPWMPPLVAALALALAGLGMLAYGVERDVSPFGGAAPGGDVSSPGAARLASALPANFTSFAPAPLAATSDPETTVLPLFNFSNADEGDHFLSTQPNWSSSMNDAMAPPNGYRLAAIEGTVFDPAQPQPPATVPLISWFSGDLRYNRATTDASWRDEHYPLRRLEGYVYDPAAAQPPGTRPLFTWYNARRGDYFTTAQAAWCMRSGKVHCPRGRGSDTPSRDGYEVIRLEGFVD